MCQMMSLFTDIKLNLAHGEFLGSYLNSGVEAMQEYDTMNSLLNCWKIREAF